MPFGRGRFASDSVFPGRVPTAGLLASLALKLVATGVKQVGGFCSQGPVHVKSFPDDQKANERRLRGRLGYRGCGWISVERGERNVSLINIVKLAHALSVRPSKLIEPIP